MASTSSPHRKLLHSLVYWAVQRCRTSESPCRLTVSLKRPAEPASSSPLRVSVSDTGVGSKLEEFLELDALARETPVEKWDGTLLVTTTGWYVENSLDETVELDSDGINDEAIYRYRINLQEEMSSARFSKLATTYKNHAQFSGTEVCLCLSNDADVDDFILWLFGFFKKIQVLRAANLACELFVEQTGNSDSRNVCLPQDSDDVNHSVMASSIDQLVSGLKDYTLSHGNTCDKCSVCSLNRDLLKIGTGAANHVDRRKTKGLHVEVVIVIAHTASDSNCCMINSSSTQVEGSRFPMPRQALAIEMSCSFDLTWLLTICTPSVPNYWQSYGFKLKGGLMGGEGNAVLEWDNMTFSRIDIAIHTYHECAMQEWQGSQQDKYLVRKALKAALSHLKADHAGDFLSCHGQRVREYVPDLAESIAGLILSSTDEEFQDKCITLLGLGSEQDISEGAVQSSISEKMIRVIEMNDTKENAYDNVPYLFECEKLGEDSELDEEDGDEDMVFDF